MYTRRGTYKCSPKCTQWCGGKHRQMTEEDACPSCNPEWNLTQSQQSWYTRLLWISHRRSHNIQNVNDCTGIKINPYPLQSLYWKCWEEAPWSAHTSRELQLEISWWVYHGRDNYQSQQTHGEESTSAHGDEMTSKLRKWWCAYLD